MKTPYFLIDKIEFDYTVSQLNKAIATYWPNTKVGYSVKSNSMPWVLSYMKEQGFYAEVVSDDEYSLAKACGYSIDKIIYNGIAKEKESFKEAVGNGAVVNIDSWREIEWISEIDPHVKKHIGIRVNFDLESMCPGQTAGGKEGSRFGISYENGDLDIAVHKLLSIPNVEIVGLHMHNSIPSRSLDVYCSISRKVCEIAKNLDLSLKYIDIGGGFFGGLPGKPNYSNYLAVISSELSSAFDKKSTCLIIEPGMSILAKSISYVTSVVDIKNTIYNKFVVTDGGRTQIDPIFRKNSYIYEISASNYEKRIIHDKQVVVGFTCIEGDRLFTIYNKPELKEGDKIIYRNLGAYTYSSASNFIKFLPEIYVYDGKETKKICEKWYAEDFMKKQLY